jgi:hypothetical protein
LDSFSEGLKELIHAEKAAAFQPVPSRKMAHGVVAQVSKPAVSPISNRQPVQSSDLSKTA